MGTERRIRVLLAKVGLDAHDRGVLVVGKALRDAGMEVIYLGLHRTIEEVVQAAIQEDVDVVGLSSLADSHLTLAPRVVNGLRENGRGDIPVVVGGLIQPGDRAVLVEAGVADTFGHNSNLDEITSRVRGLFKESVAS